MAVRLLQKFSHVEGCRSWCCASQSSWCIRCYHGISTCRVFRDRHNSPSEIVSFAVKLSPPLEVVDSIVMVTVDRELEIEVAVVVDMSVAVLEVELDVTEVVPVLGGLGGGLAIGVTGGTIGNVVFRAGHPKDPESRRTGQDICRKSMPFQTTAG